MLFDLLDVITVVIMHGCDIASLCVHMDFLWSELGKCIGPLYGEIGAVQSDVIQILVGMKLHLLRLSDRERDGSSSGSCLN